jgi:predicted ester cyclase
MRKDDLAAIYRSYIACLNAQDWPRLVKFVDNDVHHNGRRLGLSRYREMLERDYEDIPDLKFVVDLLVCEPPHVAARLAFTENVFYAFRDGKIVEVWSVIDKVAIERQL